MAINVQKEGKLSDILNYDYINYLNTKENIPFRHIKDKNYVLTNKDINFCGSGNICLHLWIYNKSYDKLVKKEKEIRQKIYL